MRVGSRVRTIKGFAEVMAVSTAAAEPVHNLEIHGDHSYYVGIAPYGAHNACPKELIWSAKGYRFTKMGSADEWTFIAEKGRAPGRTTPQNWHIYEYWKDAHGSMREIHYWQEPSGRIYDPIIHPYSP